MPRLPHGHHVLAFAFGVLAAGASRADEAPPPPARSQRMLSLSLPLLSPSLEPTTPTTPAATTRRRVEDPLPPATHGLSLRASMRAAEPEGPAAGEEALVASTRADRMKRAFTAELREEAIRSRRAALYAGIPEELPELLEDDYVMEQRAHAAESLLGSAFEAAASVAIFNRGGHESKVNIRPLFAVRDHGIKVDASPTWAYRVDGPRSGYRFEVPMTPSAVRFHAYRDLRGSDRLPMRLGGGVLIDPFDEEIRAGISLQF